MPVCLFVFFFCYLLKCPSVRKKFLRQWPGHLGLTPLPLELNGHRDSFLVLKKSFSLMARPLYPPVNGLTINGELFVASSLMHKVAVSVMGFLKKGKT